LQIAVVISHTTLALGLQVHHPMVGSLPTQGNANMTLTTCFGVKHTIGRYAQGVGLKVVLLALTSKNLNKTILYRPVS
jgi:hypothetical protein